MRKFHLCIALLTLSMLRCTPNWALHRPDAGMNADGSAEDEMESMDGDLDDASEVAPDHDGDHESAPDAGEADSIQETGAPDGT